MLATAGRAATGAVAHSTVARATGPGQGAAMPGRRLVPLHAEAVPGDARLLRWVVAPATFESSGRVAWAPDPLGAMLRGANPVSLDIEPGGGSLLAAVRDAGDWARAGSALRTALHEALLEPGAWILSTAPEPASAVGLDGLVRAAVQEVLAGRLGDFIRSHGGAVDVLGVDRGVVSVRFRGVCEGCPISGVIERVRLERAVRERCPELVALRAA